MEYRKITAIVRSDCLEKVERRLQVAGVPGISVTQVKGFGEYANFFSRDWMVRHARIEIFTTAERADAIVTSILETACSGTPGDGMVAVLPVEVIYRVRTRAKAGPDEL
jgi:nitrogen regulatory protein P-II 1